MEMLTEEVYFFDTEQEASEAADKMRAERACDLRIEYKRISNGHYKMVVEVGEAR